MVAVADMAGRAGMVGSDMSASKIGRSMTTLGASTCGEAHTTRASASTSTALSAEQRWPLSCHKDMRKAKGKTSVLG